MEKKGRILIVDDEKSNITLLWDALNSDYIVQAAKNGQKAVTAAAGFLPDLILLDIIMPDMDGYSVCKTLKSRPDTRHIPIIFITTKSAANDEAKGLQMGAVDYITKPFSPAIVRARVQTHLDLKAHSDNLEQLVKERTEALSASNENLKQKTIDLEETNIALRIFLKEKNSFQKEFESKIIATLKEFILPVLNKIRLGKLTDTQKVHADLIESNIHSIITRSDLNIILITHELSTDELQIANLIFEGKTAKEINEMLNVSLNTIQSNCKNIRKKLRITNKKTNLKDYLTSLIP